MKKSGNEEKDGVNVELFTNSRLTIIAQVATYTIITIGVLGGLGYLLDQQFGTFPKIFIAGLALGYPLTQLVIYKKLKKFAQNKVENSKNSKQ